MTSPLLNEALQPALITKIVYNMEKITTSTSVYAALAGQELYHVETIYTQLDEKEEIKSVTEYI